MRLGIKLSANGYIWEDPSIPFWLDRIGLKTSQGEKQINASMKIV